MVQTAGWLRRPARIAQALSNDLRRRVAAAVMEGGMSRRGAAQRYRRMTVRPPISKQKRYPTLVLTLLHAREPDEPVGRPRIDWKLITDLPVDSHDDAVEKLQWYAMRRKIEVFHKILKSGCRAEQARLRTAERLVRLLAVFCILSWCVFWLTMLNRAEPNLEPAFALTDIETSGLDPPDPRSDARSSPSPDTRALSHQNRPARRLSRPRQGPAAGKHRHVARPLPSHRHHPRSNPENRRCG